MYLGNSPKTAVRLDYIFTATASQSTFTGLDDKGLKLFYDINNYDVFVNGVLLDKSDINTSNGVTLVLNDARNAGDIVTIRSYGFIDLLDSQVAIVIKDNFTGNGSTTTFTLSGTPVSPNNIFVQVNGVIQKVSEYSIVGSTLTFATAPSNGSDIETRIFASRGLVAETVPSDGTVTPAKLDRAYLPLTGGTLTAGADIVLQNGVSPSLGLYEIKRANGVRAATVYYDEATEEAAFAAYTSAGNQTTAIKLNSTTSGAATLNGNQILTSAGGSLAAGADFSFRSTTTNTGQINWIRDADSTVAASAGYNVNIEDFVVQTKDLTGTTNINTLTISGGTAGEMLLNSSQIQTAANFATAAEIKAGTAGKIITSDASISSMAWFDNGTQPTTVTINHNNGVNQKVTLSGNATIAAPTNVKVGLPVNLRITQDATGSRVPAWNAAFDFGDYGTPVLSTVANSEDLLTFVSITTGKLAFVGIRKRVD